MSNDYASALATYFDAEKPKQEDFAALVGCKQATVSRYINGDRFPNAEAARAIDEATKGKVPFALWRDVAAARFGLGAAA
jgi:DNA-binding transcriptional regulator YdaS (Cro superfamily)